MKILILTISLLTSISTFAKTSVNVLVNLTPAGSFNAVTEKVKGKITKTNNEFSSKRIELPIQSLKTGIELRDQHLWDHLQSKTHKRATITNLTGKDGKATADLTVNGVKKTINISYTDNQTNIEANFKVKASDFNLPPKSYLGVGVSDEVSVNVKMDYK